MWRLFIPLFIKHDLRGNDKLVFQLKFATVLSASTLNVLLLLLRQLLWLWFVAVDLSRALCIDTCCSAHSRAVQQIRNHRKSIYGWVVVVVIFIFIFMKFSFRFSCFCVWTVLNRDLLFAVVVGALISKKKEKKSRSDSISKSRSDTIGIYGWEFVWSAQQCRHIENKICWHESWRHGMGNLFSILFQFAGRDVRNGISFEID